MDERLFKGSLVSVNVGLPQDVAWQGKVVRTAVWKRSVPGRVMARRLNLEGDGQGDLAGHGGEHRAVMVYQLASYRHWEEHLQRHDFEYGQFGENLTVEGLADDEVCIGDRYRIGAALFEVTQPRVTCYRVGIRMNDPRMPALLVSHRRPGFYCRVLEEGEIGAGDRIVKVADGPEHVTVAEVDALLYLPSHPRDQLERALRVPSLSEGWKGSLRALLEAGDQGGNAGLAAATPAPAWTGFRTLRVAEVRRESDHVRSFVLEAEDRSALPVALAGQFLVFRIQPQGHASPIVRSYSMSGAPGAGTYRISVKRDSGPGSQYFHDSVNAADSLQVSAPRGSFTLVQSDRPVVLLSTGIGATPVLSMLHELVRSADSAREIWWCYGTRNGSEHPFADEVREALKGYPKGRLLIFYSAPGQNDKLGVDYDATGHLTLSSLQEIGVPRGADFYLCGPAAFLEGMSAALEAWEIPSSRIHSEAFGSGPAMTPGIAAAPTKTPHPPTGDAGTGPEVSFIRSGITVPWNAQFGSLLEFAEACDVPVRWSCRVGVCHNCQTGTISGSVKYDPEPLDQPAENDILICCATPSSKIELDL
jgi:ferredoxin-NADP reductase/MOSC domain-containing protein YiiM/ferredoxin